MSFETRIALRYLRRSGQLRFLPWLTLIAVCGILLSSGSFWVIHSVMNGFSTFMKKSLIGDQAHLSLTIHGENTSIEEWIKSQRSFQSLEEVVEFHGVIQTESGKTLGGKVRGGEFKEEKVWNWEPLPGDEELPGVYLGDELFTRMGSTEGERVRIIYPLGDIGPTGDIEPRQQEFAVKGIFHTGFYEVDSQAVRTDLKSAQALFPPSQKLTQWRVMLKDETQSEKIKTELLKKFPSVKAETWQERNLRLFQALKLERLGMFILLGIVTFIAALNIVGLLSLVTMEKLPAMATLFSLGATRKQVQKIFFQYAGILGGIGTALGLTFAAILLWVLENSHLPLPEAYYIDHLPIKRDYFILIFLAILTPAVTIFISYIPIRRLSGFNPILWLKLK